MSAEFPSYKEALQNGHAYLEEDSNGMGKSEAAIKHFLEAETQFYWTELGLNGGYDEIIDDAEVLVSKEDSRAILYMEAYEGLMLPVAGCTVRVCKKDSTVGSGGNNQGINNYRPPTTPKIDFDRSNMMMVHDSII